MSSEAERIDMYEIVLTDGTAENVRRCVKREELLRCGRACGCRRITTGLGPRLGVAVS
jgi:hypothetical protein